MIAYNFTKRKCSLCNCYIKWCVGLLPRNVPVTYSTFFYFSDKSYLKFARMFFYYFFIYLLL